MVRRYISWEDTHSLCNSIHQQITKQGEKFDKIVGIVRGGAIPGVILSHLLGVNLYTIGLKTYDGDQQTDKITVYGLDPVFYVNCRNKRILIVDDICDSGQSITILKDIFDRCTTIPPKFATLHYKPTAQIVPDYWAELTKDYIVYPWENSINK